MKAPLGEIFAATGIRFIAGMVERIDVEGRQVHVAGAGSDTSQQVIGYDRLVLAAGSRLHCPPIPGLQAHTFNVDQLAAAAELDEHIRSLAARPASARRNTVVIAGAGFTGIETAAEMPARLRQALGDDSRCTSSWWNATRMSAPTWAPVRDL